jgi:hypothetical protein
MAFMLATGDWVKANGGGHGVERECWSSIEDGVGDEVIERLIMLEGVNSVRSVELTECSSCFTLYSVPSLKTQLATSTSGEAASLLVTRPLEVKFFQKVEKLPSLIKCQTLDNGCSMTADSETWLPVGIVFEDMIRSFGFV